MPHDPRRPLRSAPAVALLAAALVLGGCADDEPGPTAASSEAAPSATDSPDAVDTLIQTGLTQIGEGDLEAARGTFASVLALEEGNVFAHYNLGYVAQLDGDTATAAEQYDLALASDPAFAPALYNLAILTETTDLDAAVALYRRAVESAPDDAATHMRLGFALQHLGETEEGQRELDRGVELDPAMADVEPPTYAE